jgi:hypothetical protein
MTEPTKFSVDLGGGRTVVVRDFSIGTRDTVILKVRYKELDEKEDIQIFGADYLGWKNENPTLGVKDFLAIRLQVFYSTRASIKALTADLTALLGPP